VETQALMRQAVGFGGAKNPDVPMDGGSGGGRQGGESGEHAGRSGVGGVRGDEHVEMEDDEDEPEEEGEPEETEASKPAQSTTDDDWPDGLPQSKFNFNYNVANWRDGQLKALRKHRGFTSYLSMPTDHAQKIRTVKVKGKEKPPDPPSTPSTPSIHA